MSGRRSWVDAFDRVPVSYSARDEVTPTGKVQAALRLHSDRGPNRRRNPLAVVRTIVTRLFAGSGAGISALR